MPGVEKDEMEIQNSCLQDLVYFVFPLLEHTESNLHKHHPLCIVLLMASIVVLATPN